MFFMLLETNSSGQREIFSLSLKCLTASLPLLCRFMAKTSLQTGQKKGKKCSVKSELPYFPFHRYFFLILVREPWFLLELSYFIHSLYVITGFELPWVYVRRYERKKHMKLIMVLEF